MKLKSLLSQLRPDDAVRKSSVSSQAPPPESRNKYPTFSVKYSRTQSLEGNEDGRHVFLAKRKSDNLCVAVKTFGRRKPSEPELVYRKKIGQEFIIGSQLRHINMIKVFDLINEPSGEWLQVMEYAPNNLFDRVGSMKMSQGEIDCSFAQIASGVSYLHACGFAHRDLKLENIVYHNDGVMKLIDFGTATLVKKPGDQRPKLSQDYVGSLPYMAPEIIQRTTYDPQTTDIWSLAILYCCIVLGNFPWKQANITDPDFVTFVYGMEVKEDSPSSSTQTTRDTSPSSTAVEEKSSTTTQAIRPTKGQLPTCLSPESRPVINAMLNIDWPVRLTARQVVKSKWVSSIKTCAMKSQSEGEFRENDTRRVCTHQHI